MRRRTHCGFTPDFNPLTIARKRREEGWKPCPCGCSRWYDSWWVEMRLAGLRVERRPIPGMVSR